MVVFAALACGAAAAPAQALKLRISVPASSVVGAPCRVAVKVGPPLRGTALLRERGTRALAHGRPRAVDAPLVQAPLPSRGARRDHAPLPGADPARRPDRRPLARRAHAYRAAAAHAAAATCPGPTLTATAPAPARPGAVRRRGDGRPAERADARAARQPARRPERCRRGRPARGPDRPAHRRRPLRAGHDPPHHGRRAGERPPAVQRRRGQPAPPRPRRRHRGGRRPTGQRCQPPGARAGRRARRAGSELSARPGRQPVGHLRTRLLHRRGAPEPDPHRVHAADRPGAGRRPRDDRGRGANLRREHHGGDARGRPVSRLRADAARLPRLLGARRRAVVRDALGRRPVRQHASGDLQRPRRPARRSSARSAPTCSRSTVRCTSACASRSRPR